MSFTRSRLARRPIVGLRAYVRRYPARQFRPGTFATREEPRPAPWLASLPRGYPGWRYPSGNLGMRPEPPYGSLLRQPSLVASLQPCSVSRVLTGCR